MSLKHTDEVDWYRQRNVKIKPHGSVCTLYVWMNVSLCVRAKREWKQNHSKENAKQFRWININGYCFISFPKSNPTHVALLFAHTHRLYIEINKCVQRRCISMRSGSKLLRKCIPEIVSVKYNEYTYNECRMWCVLTHLRWTDYSENESKLQFSYLFFFSHHSSVYFLRFLLFLLWIWINKNRDAKND